MNKLVSITLRPCCSVVRSLHRGISRDVGQPTHYTHPELLDENDILPGITKLEFAQRRRRLMEEISRTHSGMTNPNHVVIIPGSTLRYMSHDIFYRFHQNNDFLYLTGFREPDSVLVMESNSIPEHRAVLYVTPRNPIKERWEGPIMGPDDAVKFLGVDEAYELNTLVEHFEKKYSRGNYSVWYYHTNELPSAVGESANAAVYEHILNGPDASITSVHSPLRYLQSLRAVKSDAEINLMKMAGQIAAEAFKQTISLTTPSMYEYQLESHFEHSCRLQGAQRLSFVPVVAGGDRGCSLHYTTNEQKLRDGELVLMDAGAEYFGYVSDITRTWPVNGSFNGYQTELYEAVLRIKDACIECCQVGITLNYLNTFSKELMARELKNLGILPMRLEGTGLASIISSLYPHDLGHYLGMDVHDCHLIGHNIQLQPGMVITVEPGVYINKQFPIKDPKKAKGFQGLAIRVEDNVLITDECPVVLNSGTPQTVGEIEKLMDT